MKTVFCLGTMVALMAAPVLAEQPVWGTFNGNLAATKFSDAATLTPQSVPGLERAWEVRTGDVSDGTGEVPATVWSMGPSWAATTIETS